MKETDMTVVNLPPLPAGFTYTGEWRTPGALEYYIDLEGKLRVAMGQAVLGAIKGGAVFNHHIVSGPANQRVDFLSRQLREANAATWGDPDLKGRVVDALLETINAAMRDA